MQLLQCKVGVVEPALGAAAGWAGGLWGLRFWPFCSFSAKEEEPLGNHCAQIPASVQESGLGHTMGH